LFELSEGDVRLPKLFRQTVPQCWPGGGKTVVTELVAWSLDQCITMSRLFHTKAVCSRMLVWWQKVVTWSFSFSILVCVCLFLLLNCIFVMYYVLSHWRNKDIYNKKMN